MECVFCASTNKKTSYLSHNSYAEKLRNFLYSDEYKNIGYNTSRHSTSLEIKNNYRDAQNAKLKEFRDSNCQSKICLTCFTNLAATSDNIITKCPACAETVNFDSFTTEKIRKCVYCDVEEDNLDKNTFMAKLTCGCSDDTFICFGCKRSKQPVDVCPKCNIKPTKCTFGII